MGFLALKCGAAPDEIENCPDPESVPNVDWPAAFIKVDCDNKLINSELTTHAIDINDGPAHSKAKERELIKIFKKAGITLSFKGKVKH